MLDTKDILGKFDSLKDYEKFNLDWTKACASINPTEDNVERHNRQKRRAELMGVEV